MDFINLILNPLNTTKVIEMSLTNLLTVLSGMGIEDPLEFVNDLEAEGFKVVNQRAFGAAKLQFGIMFIPIKDNESDMSKEEEQEERGRKLMNLMEDLGLMDDDSHLMVDFLTDEERKEQKELQKALESNTYKATRH